SPPPPRRISWQRPRKARAAYRGPTPGRRRVGQATSVAAVLLGEDGGDTVCPLLCGEVDGVVVGGVVIHGVIDRSVIACSVVVRSVAVFSGGFLGRDADADCAGVQIDRTAMELPLCLLFARVLQPAQFFGAMPIARAEQVEEDTHHIKVQ